MPGLFNLPRVVLALAFRFPLLHTDFKSLGHPPSARFGLVSAQLRSLCSLQLVPRETTPPLAHPLFATRQEVQQRNAADPFRGQNLKAEKAYDYLH
ncbi:hypothetical protein Brsp01_53550 [Brucella sp. NBRC 12950]|nr:hypothetical protein Brsp01_53550 [Brucella sp. NBRC 12950]